jgi:hypothetical protein
MKDLIALAIIFLVVFLPLTIIPVYAPTPSYTWVYYQQYITPNTLLVPVLWQYVGNGVNAQVSLISTTSITYPYNLYLGYNYLLIFQHTPQVVV